MGLFSNLIKKPSSNLPPSPSFDKAGSLQANSNQSGEKPFAEGLVTTKDIIAPSAIEVDTDYIKLGNRYYRTVFTVINRRFVEVNWLSSLINFDATQTVTFYIYPSDGKEILDDLRRKIAEMEAEITTDVQRGRVVNPSTQAKLEDALNLQADLVKGEERFFQMGLYITLNAEKKEDLDKVTKNLEATMGSLMVLTKKTSYQAEDGFITTLPLCQDKLNITRNMDTTSLATTFPFVSSDLSDDKGIMFGINEHNGSLVIFDRFSMPNYNSVVFATAGAGKSYMIKLEALRSLMMGVDVIVIDPENEYRTLAEAAGGQYIAFGYQDQSKINPFDLALEGDDGDNALNSKILTLHKLFKIMLGEMDAIEESLLDRAVVEAYKAKGITPDPETQKREPPLIEDLYKALIGMEEQKAAGIAARLEKYIKGSFAGIFNQKTNVNLTSHFVVFGIRNLEDALRPMAMQIILDYIWTLVKKELRKRILVVDEAWYLMQYQDSASFLRGIVKRGRKYYLGVTTITQDVDDFLETPYGREIVTNSSIQILLKQHSAAIDQIGEVFYLSEGEKQLLLSADKGEGIFFAGQNHVAIRVIASEEEHGLITSNPEEVLKNKKLLEELKNKPMTMEKTGIEIKPMEVKPPILADTPVITNLPPTPSELKPLPLRDLPLTGEANKPQNNDDVVEIPIRTAQPVVAENVTVTQETTPAPIPTTVLQNNLPPTQTEDKPLPLRDLPLTGEANTAPTDNTAEMLKKKIAEMEEVEKVKIEDHKKKVEEESAAAKALADKEEKNNKLLFSGGMNKLPSYQELFKSSSNKLPPLPPLPPLPKTDSNKSLFKAEAVVNDKNKPSFVAMPKEEVKIPQPPQLQKKPASVLSSQELVISEQKTVNSEENKVVKPELKPEEKPKADGEMTYDDLFGNGIV